MNKLGLIKSDFWRSLLIIADSMVVFGAYIVALILYFEGTPPFAFQIQAYFLSILFWCLTIGSFAYLRVYSRKLPNFSTGDFKQVALNQFMVLALFYLISSWVSPKLWMALIVFIFVTFCLRAMLGLWASYTRSDIPSFVLFGLPLIFAFLTSLLMGSQDLNGMNATLIGLPISKSVSLVYFFLSLSGFVGIRSLESYIWSLRKGKKQVQKVIAIGNSESLARMMRFNDKEGLFEVKSIVSFDANLNGIRINRVLVESAYLEDLNGLLKKHKVKKILLSKRLTTKQLRVVEKQISGLGSSVIEMDSFIGSVQTGSKKIGLKEVSIGDLLNRKEYQFIPSFENNYIKNKTILITGAGGSIGSELCRQVLECNPMRLVILGKGENSIFNIMLELQRDWPNINVIPIILSVTNQRGLDEVFEKYKPQIVFHAAAHKHVFLMELNPKEAELNNVQGTMNVAELCGVKGVEKFVLISTDKAVRPSSVMGSSKAKAERSVLKAKKKYPSTDYRMVRFGNVLGSRGSVIPIFLEQIARGGPITVTDPKVKRYFMSIPEAVSLVLTAAVLKELADVYVLEMGEQVFIVDLAKHLIEQAGLVYGEDIKFEYTGLKAGEKLEEELWEGEKQVSKTENDRIYGVSLSDVRLESN